MKHIFKEGLKLLAVAVLAASGTGCEKDAAFKEYEYPVPEITEFYPVSGYAGSQVAIMGTDFGNDVEAVGVTFGGVEVENILSCTNERIIVQLPEGAQSGKIGLTVWNHAVESPADFTVIPTPTVTAVESNNTAGTLFAMAGDEVTVTGDNFGTDASNVSVTIEGLENDVQAEIVSVSQTQIVFLLPDSYNEMGGNVVLNVGGYEVEGNISLINPSAEGDVTQLFLQNYEQPFLGAGDAEWTTGLYWMTSNGFGSNMQFGTSYPDGVLAIQGGWGQPQKTNGKLYQFATLPSGHYTCTVHVVENTKAGGRYGTVFAVARGESLPDLMTDTNQDVNGAKQWNYVLPIPEELLAYTHVTAGTFTEPLDYTLEFDLTETTEVTIGFVAMMYNSNNVKVSSIKIERSIE